MLVAAICATRCGDRVTGQANDATAGRCPKIIHDRRDWSGPNFSMPGSKGMRCSAAMGFRPTPLRQFRHHRRMGARWTFVQPRSNGAMRSRASVFCRGDWIRFSRYSREAPAYKAAAPGTIVGIDGYADDGAALGVALPPGLGGSVYHRGMLTHRLRRHGGAKLPRDPDWVPVRPYRRLHTRRCRSVGRTSMASCRGTHGSASSCRGNATSSLANGLPQQRRNGAAGVR